MMPVQTRGTPNIPKPNTFWQERGPTNPPAPLNFKLNLAITNCSVLLHILDFRHFEDLIMLPMLRFMLSVDDATGP